MISTNKTKAETGDVRPKKTVIMSKNVHPKEFSFEPARPSNVETRETKRVVGAMLTTSTMEQRLKDARREERKTKRLASKTKRTKKNK